MQFFDQTTAPQRSDDIVFHYSKVKPVVFTVFLFFLTILLVYFGVKGGFKADRVFIPRYLCFWVAGVTSIIFSISVSNLFSLFRPTNWLMRINEFQIVVKFRSYLNYKFDSNDKQIFSVNLNELASARKIIKSMTVSHLGETKDIRRVYLSIELKNMDLSVLKRHLVSERTQKFSSQFHVKSRNNHFPVTLNDKGELFIDFTSITPSVDEAISRLSKFMKILSEERIIFNYNIIGELKEKEKKNRIVELVDSGHTIEAVQIAKSAFNLDTTEAKKLVDRFIKESV